MTGTGSDHGSYSAIIGVGVILLAAAIFLIIRHLNRNNGKSSNSGNSGKSGKARTKQRTGDSTLPHNSVGRLTSPSLEDIQKAPVVEAAAWLARELHKGQVDKAGKDYFEGHLTAVADAGRDWKEKTVGYLHDAAEDTYRSVPQVMQKLKETLAAMPLEDAFIAPTYQEWQELTEALDLLNANTAPTREAYIERFRGHELALRVKLNDMQNNMDLSRLSNPGERDIMRIERYRKEYVQLREMLEELKNK